MLKYSAQKSLLSSGVFIYNFEHVLPSWVKRFQKSFWTGKVQSHKYKYQKNEWILLKVNNKAFRAAIVLVLILSEFHTFNIFFPERSLVYFNSFMLNVKKWPKHVWPFFHIMHENVNRKMPRAHLQKGLSKESNITANLLEASFRKLCASYFKIGYSYHILAIRVK